MTDFIYVEPGQHRKGLFALWCIGQDPQIQTSSSTGFNLTVEQYADVPPDLLKGAYVDGFPYDVAQAQPVTPPADEPKPELPKRPTSRKPTRKRAAPKPEQKPHLSGRFTERAGVRMPEPLAALYDADVAAAEIGGTAGE